jgi:radical SAM superfamily enzyme YgiQ (UPF0313 family)
MTNIVLTRSKHKREIPLGLMVLKSYLDQTSHRSQIFDLSLERNSPELLEELILRDNIDFIGLSVGSITHKIDIELIKRLKKSTKAKIIIGGAFANTPRVFNEYVDYTILGRGEEKLLKLLDEYDGTKSKTPDHKIDIDLVNFQDYQSPKDYNGNREFPLYTSTGCKFRCIYCSIPQINRHRVWFKDSEIIGREIDEIISKGISHLRFVDDLFGLDKNRTGLLLPQIKKASRLQGVYTQLRVDCTTNELLKQMRDSGFSGIYFGIESGDETTLRRIGKPYTQQEVRRLLQCSRQLGFDITGAFTMGYPWETRENIQRTLCFADEMRHQFNLRPSVYIVTPFAGTPLSKQINPSAIKIKDYTLWDAKHAVMDTTHLKREEIQEIYDNFRAGQNERY